MKSGPLSPPELAAILLSDLERRGAVFTLTDEGDLRTDLNPVAGLTYESAEAFAYAVLGLRDEIKAQLRARLTIH